MAVESQRGFSWTDTQYKIQGTDATDSYQLGLPAVLPDVQALDAVVVRSSFAQMSFPQTRDRDRIGEWIAMNATA